MQPNHLLLNYPVNAALDLLEAKSLVSIRYETAWCSQPCHPGCSPCKAWAMDFSLTYKAKSIHCNTNQRSQFFKTNRIGRCHKTEIFSAQWYPSHICNASMTFHKRCLPKQNIHFTGTKLEHLQRWTQGVSVSFLFQKNYSSRGQWNSIICRDREPSSIS